MHACCRQVDGMSWQPTAPLDNLRARAALLHKLRQFFARREVLEVSTPCIARYTVTEPYIDSIAVPGYGYLQSSPEYAMKRLLAAGSGPIYQIAPAFRGGESGKRHNPQFTLLEWYRPGFDELRLMEEVEALCRDVLSVEDVLRYSYREVFESLLGIDPHDVSLETLQALVHEQQQLDYHSDCRDDWLQILMSSRIEPALNPQQAIFIYDFPAGQAALARIEQDAQGVPVARRFELFYRGMELANGYHELCDAAEQQRRFNADLQRRRRLGLAEPEPDTDLLAALEAGLPACAGVAMGFERLLMATLQETDIARVMSFR